LNDAYKRGLGLMDAKEGGVESKSGGGGKG